MALSANKTRTVQKPELSKKRNLNVAASTTIYRGAIVCKDASGNAVAAPAGQTLDFMGVAIDGYDNTVALATTERELALETGHLELFTFDAAIDDTDLGSPVWYKDDGTVTLTDPTSTTQMGILQRVKATPLGWVDLSKSET
jgi:hypothetical protein